MCFCECIQLVLFSLMSKLAKLISAVCILQMEERVCKAELISSSIVVLHRLASLSTLNSSPGKTYHRCEISLLFSPTKYPGRACWRFQCARTSPCLFSSFQARVFPLGFYKAPVGLLKSHMYWKMLQSFVDSNARLK